MGFRFRRSWSLLPGIRFNVGKKSASLSFGGRGLHYTAGTAGRRVTVGIPGTGLSWTQKLGSPIPRAASPPLLGPAQTQPVIASPQAVSPPAHSPVMTLTARGVAQPLPGAQTKKMVPAWVLWSVPCLIAIAAACVLAAAFGH